MSVFETKQTTVHLCCLAQTQEFGEFIGDLISSGVFNGLLADDDFALMSAKYVFNERE